jgi:BON domain-containing protein
MAHDFEDIHDLDDLNDDEMRALVRTHLAADEAIDERGITVHVEDGFVTLGGTVGTEAELRIAEHIVTDVLGIEQYDNQLAVDPTQRAISSIDVEEHLAEEEAVEGRLLGDRPVPLSPEAEHLEEDLDARLYGTTDVQAAIEEGTAWIPPESPTPEGRDISDAR